MSSFEVEQLRNLDVLLDVLIPPEGELPGAGEIGVAGAILEAVEQTPVLGTVIAQGLDRLSREAHERGGQPFDTLSVADRAAVVQTVAEAEPALVPSLLFHTYTNYYRHPKVMAVLGMEPRAPFPEGYSVEMGDLSLLDPVRARGPLFRAVDDEAG